MKIGPVSLTSMQVQSWTSAMGRGGLVGREVVGVVEVGVRTREFAT